MMTKITEQLLVLTCELALVYTMVDSSRLLPVTGVTISLLGFNSVMMNDLSEMPPRPLSTLLPPRLSLMPNISFGCKFNEPKVKCNIKHWLFKVINKGGKPMIQVKNKNELKDFTPEEISTMVLTKMKETAEAYLGMKVTHTIITIPAYLS
ncbi:hypothetical protein RSAG8_12212, partial [Rhizoctonia solani AG-8 WAC10335]